MYICLEIKKDNKARLSLRNGKKVEDWLEWEENNSLSRLLLKKLDKILRRNGIGVDKISGYKIINDVPKNWTSARIAGITFESLGIAGARQNFTSRKLKRVNLPKKTGCARL
ncbi:MAG: hypothetical protein A3J76_02975 [Candidatus Moranbacteria bacterium RBG_13_45_13]|nr:MAG: hypothetical protein A3J76_02975 [Candidatus Moranbacteria bacterium RBG_13_45_13]